MVFMTETNEEGGKKHTHMFVVKVFVVRLAFLCVTLIAGSGSGTIFVTTPNPQRRTAVTAIIHLFAFSTGLCEVHRTSTAKAIVSQDRPS